MSQVREMGDTFVETVSVDDVLAVLTSTNEPLTATEIADMLNVSNRTVLDRLNALNETNPTVIHKEVGASAVVWFIKHRSTSRRSKRLPSASRIEIDDNIEYDVTISKILDTKAGIEEHRDSSFLQNFRNDGQIYG